MTTVRLVLAHFLIWLLTLGATPAVAIYPAMADLQQGIAQSIYAGLQEREPERLPGQTDEEYLAIHTAWKADITAQANLLGAAVGYITSSRQAANVTNAATIAKSGAVNNYLGHTQFAQMIDDFRECDGDTACLRERLSVYRELSLRQEHEMALCGTNLSCLSEHIPHLLDTADNELINSFITQLTPQDLQDPVALQLMRHCSALHRLPTV